MFLPLLSFLCLVVLLVNAILLAGIFTLLDGCARTRRIVASKSREVKAIVKENDPPALAEWRRQLPPRSS